MFRTLKAAEKNELPWIRFDACIAEVLNLFFLHYPEINIRSYTTIYIKQELLLHIKLVEDEANALYETLIESLKAKEHITEQFKADDPVEWARPMNNIKNRNQEIVLNQIVYR